MKCIFEDIFHNGNSRFQNQRQQGKSAVFIDGAFASYNKQGLRQNFIPSTPMNLMVWKSYVVVGIPAA